MTQKVSLDLVDLGGGQLAGLRNKIINGKMEVGQRGTSFAGLGVSGSYTLDRFVFANNCAAVATVSQQADAPSGNEFQSSLRVAVTTADNSIAAADISNIVQIIEGYNARDLIGRTFTLSFWVRSSKTGVHCVATNNNTQDRSYVAEYTVNAANTWEFKSVTVTGGLITSGTWDWTNGIGLRVRFNLAAGSNFHTTAGAWQTGAFTATANQVNCLDTIGNVFAITGVQLEVGSVATPFEHRPYGMELALCQRYYYRQTFAAASHVFGAGIATSATAAQIYSQFPVTLRAAPSALEQSGTAGSYTVQQASGGVACSSVPTFTSASNFGAVTTLTVGSGLTAGQAVFGRIDAASNHVGWSAEL